MSTIVYHDATTLRLGTKPQEKDLGTASATVRHLAWPALVTLGSGPASRPRSGIRQRTPILRMELPDQPVELLRARNQICRRIL